MKRFHGKEVVILCPGYNLLKYKDQVIKYVSDNKCITIGCNHISHIYKDPDYHMFADFERFENFGHTISEKSIPVFPKRFEENFIRKICQREYVRFKCRYTKSFKISMIKGMLTGHFKTVGLLAILFAYMDGASSIKVAGMDGYAFFSKEELDSQKVSQHCYGEGYTDIRNYKFDGDKIRGAGSEFWYERAKDKDKIISGLLQQGEDFGAKFEIITPTVYKKYYNPNALVNV